MDKESDVIKHQMEHTRAALADKLEQLECQVSDTVTGAAETVEKVRQTVQETVSGAAETVASVKDAFQNTVESVKSSVRDTASAVGETLDLRRQVEEHPWGMMCGATAVGFGVGVLVSRVNIPATMSHAASAMHLSSWRDGRGSSREYIPGDHSPQWTGPRGQVEPQPQPVVHQESVWAPAVNQLKGLAIGTFFGVLRDILSKNVPSAISGQLGEVIDNVTSSLGGKPIAGKVLPDSWNGGRRHRADPSPGSEGWRAQGRDWQEPIRPRQTAMADIEE